jgi:hypothetical protein
MGMIPSHIDADKLIDVAISPTELYDIKEGIREQLRKGILDPKKGGEAQRQYSPNTIRRRRSRGLSTSFVNLNYSGQLYRSVLVTRSGMTLKTTNASPTYDKLLSDSKTGSWSQNVMAISRPLMDRFKHKVSMKVVRSII